MKRKGFLIGLIVLLFMILGGQTALAQSPSTTNINVVIDQYKLIIFPDQKPYIDENDRTMVPVRFVSEELGATVLWNSYHGQATIYFEGEIVRLTPNSNIATVREGSTDKQVDMGTKAVLTNGRVMVPLRFIMQTFGSLVTWDDVSQTVFIERLEQIVPDEVLLGKFAELDTQFLDRISNRSGYKLLKDWQTSDGARTSKGAFTDYAISITEKQFADTFLFDFDTLNYNNISWISIYFTTEATHNNFFYYDLTPDVIQNKKQVIINRDQFSIGSGNPKWEDVKYFRIAFQSKSGTSFTIEPNALATYNGSNAMITLWFDDGWEDNYTNALRITTKIDPTIHGTIGLVGSLLGTDRYLKKEQLPIIKDAGWEFVSHSYTHPLLTELTDEEILTEIERNFNVVSKYDPIGAYHFVVPFSSVDERVLKVIQENTLSARFIPESLDSIPFDRHRLGFIEVTSTTDFKTLKKEIDDAIENNRWIGLLFHRIEDPAVDRYSYGTLQFEQLIYYLSYMKNDIKVVTPSEAFSEAGMPIIVSP